MQPILSNRYQTKDKLPVNIVTSGQAYIPQPGAYLKFLFTRIARWIAILLKRRRNLEKISFDYYRSWHFDNAYLVIDFYFKNAIWLKIGSVRSVNTRQPLVLNLQNIKANKIKFEVYGFFQKQKYEIGLNKETALKSELFDAKFENIKTGKIIRQDIKKQIEKFGDLNEISIARYKILTQMPRTCFLLEEPVLSIGELLVETSTIKINHNNFKTQDYI